MPVELRSGLSPFDALRERREANLFALLDTAKEVARSAASAIDRAIAAIEDADAALLDAANSDIVTELADPAQTSTSTEVLAEIAAFRQLKTDLETVRATMTT